jgi:hypothetical protein
MMNHGPGIRLEYNSSMSSRGNKRYSLLLHPKPGTAAAAARDFGIDLTLAYENLKLSPEERVRRLDNFRDSIVEIRKAVKKSRRNAKR